MGVPFVGDTWTDTECAWPRHSLQARQTRFGATPLPERQIHLGIKRTDTVLNQMSRLWSWYPQIGFRVCAFLHPFLPFFFLLVFISKVCDGVPFLAIESQDCVVVKELEWDLGDPGSNPSWAMKLPGSPWASHSLSASPTSSSPSIHSINQTLPIAAKPWV